MAKIRDIIDRELISRVGKVNYKQEFGVVTQNTTGQNTTFATYYRIDKISFVTINGVVQAPERDYTIKDDFTIEFIGIIKEGRTIIIGYYYDKITQSQVIVSPSLQLFTIDKLSGGVNKVKFSVGIVPGDGVNFFWSIHKDGGSDIVLNPAGEPLTGTELTVINGVGSTSKVIEYEITQEEFDARAGDSIPFTLIVVYDLTNRPGEDEKLVGSVVYAVEQTQHSTLSLDIFPSTVITSPVVDKNFQLTYTVNKGNYSPITWSLSDPNGNILDSGNELDTPINKELNVLHSFTYGDTSKTYRLDVGEGGTNISKEDTIPVNITEDAEIGWWAHSRYAEIYQTDSITFSSKAEEGVHDYMPIIITEEPIGTESTAVLVNDAIVEAEENGQVIQGKHLLLKIPKSWGNIKITYEGNELVSSSFEIYPGDVNDINTKNYNWYIHEDAIALVAEPTIGIERV